MRAAPPPLAGSASGSGRSLLEDPAGARLGFNRPIEPIINEFSGATLVDESEFSDLDHGACKSMNVDEVADLDRWFRFCSLNLARADERSSRFDCRSAFPCALSLGVFDGL